MTHERAGAEYIRQGFSRGTLGKKEGWFGCVTKSVQPTEFYFTIRKEMVSLEPSCVVDAAVVVCLLAPATVGDDGWGASDAAALFKRLTMRCGV